MPTKTDEDCYGCDRPIPPGTELEWDGAVYCDAACLDPGDRASLDEDRNAQWAMDAVAEARLGL